MKIKKNFKKIDLISRGIQRDGRFPEADFGHVRGFAIVTNRKLCGN